MTDKIIQAEPGFQILQLVYDRHAGDNSFKIVRYPVVACRVSAQGIVDVVSIGFKTNMAAPYVLKTPNGEIHCFGDHQSPWPSDMVPCWASENEWVEDVKSRMDRDESESSLLRH